VQRAKRLDKLADLKAAARCSLAGSRTAGSVTLAVPAGRPARQELRVGRDAGELLLGQLLAAG